jgi:phenylacetate-CoA ligase
MLRLAEAIYGVLPPLAQDAAASAWGLAKRRTRFSPHFRRTLDSLMESDRWPLCDLEALQDERLRELAAHAFEHVRYYHRLFRSLRLCPEDIRSRGDLRKLPMLEKETVRASPRDFTSRAFARGELTRGHTSGTTGSGLALLYEPRAQAEEFACVWRLRRRLGLDLHDPSAVFRGLSVVPQGRLKPPFWRRNWASGQVLLSQYHLSPETAPDYLEALGEFGAAYFEGYPSFMYLLASHCLERGRAILPRPRAAFTSSETLFPHQRRVIEEGFGTRVHDRYGNAEFSCSMVECERGRLHLDIEFGIAELDVHERGEGWERGELVCTGFANRAMPLLRYRTGDIATRLTAPCPCGRERPAFARVDGRIEDYVVTASGVRVGRLDHVFKDMTRVREAQIVQERPGEVTVRVVRGTSYSPRDERRLERELRARLGAETAVEIQHVARIPRERSGKLRLVKSSLGTASTQSSQRNGRT